MLKYYDLGIQGDTGILKSDIINKFNLGLINFHPGDLPKYRGCSAQEWQLCENNDIISTCHLIDQWIVTGPVLAKPELNLVYKNCDEFRSKIYKETSIFTLKSVAEIVKGKKIKELKIQNKN